MLAILDHDINDQTQSDNLTFCLNNVLLLRLAALLLALSPCLPLLPLPRPGRNLLEETRRESFKVPRWERKKELTRFK